VLLSLSAARHGVVLPPQTRQRPQLLFDDVTDAPTWLITAGSFEGNNPDLQMLTHTFMQAFNSTKLAPCDGSKC
jgi:hypothetical protein